ncbi:outer membrane protein assembly factor BamC [Modicisalibacter tunisiensis]|uniref:Outer membrane protein assembly factor BamC n=1 Tax=Modicisalibacter tunisiensis TaxID=390637 RepID=A0ABS7WVU6_9GAMM|nr:outer membrane protein assembly factor BamC [Modicisalibacter tunisiensis]MBZ9540288.1 outer membrane protein assembly factor BamC [Modicisalibacter tunisiensis]MBZ9566304.1 outer membrane protein assembly factor BamC [Modicisalibacter tunisiensis]
MKPVFKWMPLVVAVGVVVSGCGGDGYYYDRNDEYRAAEMAPPLELPDSRPTGRYQNAMPVPDVNNDFAADGEFEAPRPQPLAGGEEDEAPYVQLRKAGNDRWLLVNAAPGGVWPQLQRFVQTRGLTATTQDASRGLIVTPQAELSVRQGLREATSEVRCNGPASEAGECLTALKGYLDATGADTQGVSLAAQQIGQEKRVRLQNAGGQWQLVLALPQDRAWSELQYQLENNFTGDGRRLVDQNRSAGELLIDYRSSAEDGGWFDWFSSDQPQRYRLSLSDAGAGRTVVKVARADGKTMGEREAREVLDAVAATLR